MDEKKVREAIKLLQHKKEVCKRVSRCCQKYEIFKDNPEFYEIKDVELYNTAIKALEKQLPKKVVDKSLVKDNGGVIGSIGKCPDCNEIVDNTMAVCDCGQKIDWSERNE